MNILNIMGFLTFKNVMLLLGWKMRGEIHVLVFLAARLFCKMNKKHTYKIGSIEPM